MKRNNCMVDHNINLFPVMETPHVVNGKYTSRQRNLNINEHFKKIFSMRFTAPNIILQFKTIINGGIILWAVGQFTETIAKIGD